MKFQVAIFVLILSSVVLFAQNTTQDATLLRGNQSEFSFGVLQSIGADYRFYYPNTERSYFIYQVLPEFRFRKGINKFVEYQAQVGGRFGFSPYDNGYYEYVTDSRIQGYWDNTLKFNVVSAPYFHVALLTRVGLRIGVESALTPLAKSGYFGVNVGATLLGDVANKNKRRINYYFGIPVNFRFDICEFDGWDRHFHNVDSVDDGVSRNYFPEIQAGALVGINVNYKSGFVVRHEFLFMTEINFYSTKDERYPEYLVLESQEFVISIGYSISFANKITKRN